MRLVTKDDGIDFYHKLVQRGLPFIISKLNPNSKSRTLSAFDNSSEYSSNWWIIPQVKQRWNEKITGNKSIGYEEYTVNTYLKNQRNLRMLSVGSGISSHELKFATFSNFGEIICVDIAKNLLRKASLIAEQRELKNMKFIMQDILKIDFEINEFDMIMFHSSLHHFSNIGVLISDRVKKWLKPNGFLLVNEYVGKDRLQFEKNQIMKINEGLKIIPSNLKRRFKTNLTKDKFYGSGYIRMIIADASECIESSQIKPILRKQFEVVEEKGIGGNLLMNILKDISHNFLNSENVEVEETLNQLFMIEDEYLKKNESDFMFGIYRKTAVTNTVYHDHAC